MAGIPLKRVSNVSPSNLELCFRPTASKFLNLLLTKDLKAVPSMLTTKEAQYFLKKTELLNTGFLHKLSHEASLNTRIITKTAYDYAVSQKTRYVEFEHLLLAMLSCTANIQKLLTTYNSSLEVCEATTFWLVGDQERLAKVSFWQEDYVVPEMRGFGKGMTGRITPNLNAVSEDFTAQAKHGLIKPIIGREKEIKQISRILGSSKENVLIIGEPGSGKTSIVRGIASKILSGTDYPTLKNKRVVGIEAGALFAGAKTVGDIAQRIKLIMAEVQASGDIILFIDEVHNLVAGVDNTDVEISGVYSILEPYLSSGNLRVLCATSIKNYRKYIEPNGAFARLFQIVEISQASKEETLAILKAVSLDFERTQRVLITYPALKKVVDLSEKLIHERVLPDKAIDILNRAVGAVSDTTGYVTADVVAQELSEVTHVPVESLSQSDSQKLLNIEQILQQRVIGQNNALIHIGKALKRARAGVRNEKKPIASFLFVGTTGVGKTETAKALASVYFDSEKAMIRLDMSEYQQVDSINKLIGTPSGDTRGTLTDSVRSSPFNLILLDEIEKAYPTILNTFLQVLDDGRLTDTTGRVVDFTNTIIIATSNVGTRAIQDVTSKTNDFTKIQDAAMQAVRDKFTPEFLNRFNGIIVFSPLTKKNVLDITELMLKRVQKTVAEKGIEVRFKQELVSELASRGYDPQWGARPLARVIEDSVETYLATKMLGQKLSSGDELELGLEVFEDTATL